MVADNIHLVTDMDCLEVLLVEGISVMLLKLMTLCLQPNNRETNACCQFPGSNILQCCVDDDSSWPSCRPQFLRRLSAVAARVIHQRNGGTNSTGEEYNHDVEYSVRRFLWQQVGG